MKLRNKISVRLFYTFTVFTLGLLFYKAANAVTEVNVVGLFNGKAVLIVNGGKPKTYSVGEDSNGVKLISADSATATLLIEGKLKQVVMGQAATVASSSSGVETVTLYANPEGHFVSDCFINGVALKFILDTGATMVALNSGDARYAKIDYKRGTPIQLSTANGVVTAYRVSLASLRIGGLTLNQVEATVVEGGSPPIVLLGMTALNRMSMKRDDIALTLTKKY
jgi:aspartyl protease family protein